MVPEILQVVVPPEAAGRISQMARLYLSLVGAESLIETVVPLRGVGDVCL
jgi:hypothetical protein